jgi:hypothetical protein
MSNIINSQSIIGGSNNTITGYQGSIVAGSQNSAGTCGSIGIAGTIGAQGTAGPAGAWQITDWKEELQEKYNNRFTIKTEYDAMDFSPINLITDTNTNREYRFIPTNMSNIVKETDKFIQTLIVMIRDEKLDNIING